MLFLPTQGLAWSQWQDSYLCGDKLLWKYVKGEMGGGQKLYLKCLQSASISYTRRLTYSNFLYIKVVIQGHHLFLIFSWNSWKFFLSLKLFHLFLIVNYSYIVPSFPFLPPISPIYPSLLSLKFMASWSLCNFYYNIYVSTYIYTYVYMYLCTYICIYTICNHQSLYSVTCVCVLRAVNLI